MAGGAARHVTLSREPGSGVGTRIMFDARLPFVPTGDSAASGGGIPGGGLCVIGFTVRKARIADVAPDQVSDTGGRLTAPKCSPLLVSGPPVGGAGRAFH